METNDRESVGTMAPEHLTLTGQAEIASRTLAIPLRAAGIIIRHLLHGRLDHRQIIISADRAHPHARRPERHLVLRAKVLVVALVVAAADTEDNEKITDIVLGAVDNSAGEIAWTRFRRRLAV